MGKVYLLGAGATKAVALDAPLNDALLPRALRLSQDPSVISIQRFIDEFYANPAALPPLEDLLTQLDICITENRPLGDQYTVEALREIRESLISAICRVLGHDLRHLRVPHLMDIFVEQLAAEDTVITLNYDLLIDNCLTRYGHRPFYGFSVRKQLSLEDEKLRELSNMNGKADRWTLLKLHGSLNWLYCPSCRSIDVVPGRKAAIYVFDRYTLGDRPLTCNVCGGRYSPYIVTPTFLKDYNQIHVSQILQNAETKLSEASEIIFIGYSLPDADIVLRTMLSRSLYRNRALRQKANSPLQSPPITVVDYVTNYDQADEQKDATRKRYTRLFGTIDYRHTGFLDYVYEKGNLDVRY